MLGVGRGFRLSRKHGSCHRTMTIVSRNPLTCSLDQFVVLIPFLKSPWLDVCCGCHDFRGGRNRTHGVICRPGTKHYGWVNIADKGSV